MRERVKLKVVVAACALFAAVSGARAESIERSFDFGSFSNYEYKEKQRADDGLVLENIRDQRGKVAGKLSLGGKGREEDPFYNFGATQNIRAARENEMGGGILNLRVSF